MIEELDNFLNSDDAIFHYTKKETAMEYILNNKELRFGIFRKTNDPYEYNDNFPLAIGTNNDLLAAKSMSLFNSSSKNTLFLSFCNNSDKNGYKKSRMWSQYGQNHEGICLVFSKDSIMSDIQNELSENYLIYGENINYGRIEPTCIETNDNLTVNKIVLSNIKKYYKNIFFQKDLDYKDENEFRIVLIKKDLGKFSEEHFIDISNSLKFIILGDKFPEEDLAKIKNLSSKLNIKYEKLYWEHAQYFLDYNKD
jgi:hypothetical protein